MTKPSRPFTYTNHPALYYEDMLADKLRMERYRAAISEWVKPGDVVADLGTGMGVLAMMAAQAGASRVYAVDNRQNALDIARHLIEANGLSDRITLVCADAREAVVDEKVDLVVNELIGDFGTDENIYECVREFADSNLKEEGRVLPEQLSTYLVPVQYGDEFRGIWRENYEGLDLSPVLEYPTQVEPVMRIMQCDPLGLAQPQELENIRFGIGMPERAMDYPVEFTVDRAGEIQGFMGYFEASLVPGITLANHPVYPRCHWQTWHWPLHPPRQVSVGETLRAVVHARPNMIASGWTMEWD